MRGGAAAHLGPPATEGDITAAEALLDRPLPAGLLALSRADEVTYQGAGGMVARSTVVTAPKAAHSSTAVMPARVPGRVTAPARDAGGCHGECAAATVSGTIAAVLPIVPPGEVDPAVPYRTGRMRLDRAGSAVDRLRTVHFEDFLPDDQRLLEDALPLLLQLRPHLTADTLREIYREGYIQGLRFTAAYDEDGWCLGVAGWRVLANTSAGRKLYVDDLVTDEGQRGRGVGGALLNELAIRAADAGCSLLDLDSGVQRAGAHRFYFRERMTITAYHFTRPLA